MLRDHIVCSISNDAIQLWLLYSRGKSHICDRLWENDPYHARSIVVIGAVYGQQRHFIDFRFFSYSSSYVYPLKSAQVWGSNSVPFQSYGPGYQAVPLLALSLRGIIIKRNAEMIERLRSPGNGKSTSLRLPTTRKWPLPRLLRLPQPSTASSTLRKETKLPSLMWSKTTLSYLQLIVIVTQKVTVIVNLMLQVSAIKWHYNK